MKKDHAISTYLGITQLELAMLLGVSRSQFSMFELGKRDLPLHAMQLLGETAHLYTIARSRRQKRAARQAKSQLATTRTPAAQEPLPAIANRAQDCRGNQKTASTSAVATTQRIFE